MRLAELERINIDLERRLEHQAKERMKVRHSGRGEGQWVCVSDVVL